jgi:gamma-glutamylputrescine oxidase
MSSNPHAPSLYAATANPAPIRPTLVGDVEVDVCVVGAGYTGLSSAIALAESGMKVAVLEQSRIGWGASGRNGGQIVHSYSRDIDFIEGFYGKEMAKPLGEMMMEGAKVIRERIAKYNISCDLKNGGVYAAMTPKKVRQLHEHKELWEKWGNKDLRIVEDATEVRKYVNSARYAGLLIDMSGGHIHPLNLALGEAAAVEQLGGNIYENSGATRIERGAKAVVHTATGKVNAKFVIVACNAYIGDLEPALAAKTMPCGTQVIATEPLGKLADELLPTDYCVEDNNFLLDYFRLSGDKRLIYGGGVIYGARDPAHVESIIRPKMIKTFPQLANTKIDFGWTGNFSLTLSRLPQVGRLSDNIYYSQGCSGHGVTYTHLVGRLLGEVINGQAGRFDAFARLPHYPFPGGRLFRIPFTALGAWYYDMRDKLGI